MYSGTDGNEPSLTRRNMPENPVICTVDSVHPFGVFVRLHDGSQAYVRRREMTLDGVDDPRDLVKPGDEIVAARLTESSGGKLPELSVRAVQADPWQSFLRKHAEGDVVPITIKHLQADGVLATVQPGVSGFVPLSELSVNAHNKHVDEIVWVNDRSEAIITMIEPAAKRMQLSVRQWIARLNTMEPVLQSLFSDNPETGLLSSPSRSLQAAAPRRSVPTDPILVVDDDPAVRGSLMAWLSGLGCMPAVADSAEEALHLCLEKKYVLVLADLNMPRHGGADLLRQLRANGFDMPFAVMSTSEELVHQLPGLVLYSVAAAFPKPLDHDELRAFLAQLARGEHCELSLPPENRKLPDEVEKLRTLLVDVSIQTGASMRLQQRLEWVVQAAHADVGVIFRMDPAERAVSQIARSGGEDLSISALRKLRYSPVCDVIREGSTVWENSVTTEALARFRNVQSVFGCESCIGIRLEDGGRDEHALFLVARRPNVFTWHRLRDAVAGAALLGAVLESELLEEQALLFDGAFLGDKFASTFGHEMKNKVTGLDLQVAALRNRFEDLTRNAPATDRLADDELRRVNEALAQVEDLAADLRQTAVQYQRILSVEEEANCDLNQVLADAGRQLRPLAEQDGVSIRYELAYDLPPAAGSHVRLQHVFLNIMLNAIQHMEDQVSTRRVLTLKTSVAKREGHVLLQARIADSGPGIHYRLWDKIFALGFTTRSGGSGFGLYIVRILLRSIGATVKVEESLVPLGTTFLIELPAVYMATEPGDENGR